MFIIPSSLPDLSKLLVVGGVVCFTGVAPRTSRTVSPATFHTNAIDLFEQYIDEKESLVYFTILSFQHKCFSEITRKSAVLNKSVSYKTVSFPELESII